MDDLKAIKKIKPTNNLAPVELVTSGEGLIPKSMAPTTSTILGSDTYELVELNSDNNSQTVLRRTDKVFPIPEKIYGDAYRWVMLVLTDYVSNGKSSLISYGKKGNGKTLLIDAITCLSNEKFSLPIIVVGRINNGQAMVSILRQIGPCILYMDEFTKLVSYHAQEDLLSYLSSGDSDGTIVLLTTNNISNISDYIKHRPDRIKYQVYRGNVDEETIKMYCKEHLKYKEFIPKIEEAALNSDAFNMDSLMAVVSELNMRFNPKAEVPLTFKQIVGTLNVAIKSGPGYVIDKIEFKDEGIQYANVELIPQNYGRFEFKMLITLKSGVVMGHGHFSKMEHKGFENGCHKYATAIRVQGGEIRSLDAMLFIKELSPNMGDGTQAL